MIYVRFSRCQGSLGGCLLWASAAPGLRRVVIKLDHFGRSPNELTALLAHELQHALEVADAPEIKDLASFQKAFAGRGWKGAHGFETTQAREITKRVAAELSSTSEAAESGARRTVLALQPLIASTAPVDARFGTACRHARGRWGGQPEPILASAAVAVRPSNLAAASVFQSFLDHMWRSSPTFNRQCRRLVAAQRLKVVLRLEEPQRRPSFYARTVLQRRDGVLFAADVFLSPTPDAVEFIAHEVEHVLEQLDGVDLEAQVGSGNVWRRADGAFETRRATEAGGVWLEK